MKKYLGLLMVAMLVVTVGCGKQSKYEETFKEYATEHYNAHQKGNVELVDVTITKADLQNAVTVGVDEFDMSKLEGCTDTSYVKLTINQETREISNYEFNLECE